jgi:hypothetical protein
MLLVVLTIRACLNLGFSKETKINMTNYYAFTVGLPLADGPE